MPSAVSVTAQYLHGLSKRRSRQSVTLKALTLCLCVSAQAAGSQPPATPHVSIHPLLPVFRPLCRPHMGAVHCGAHVAHSNGFRSHTA